MMCKTVDDNVNKKEADSVIKAACVANDEIASGESDAKTRCLSKTRRTVTKCGEERLRNGA